MRRNRVQQGGAETILLPPGLIRFPLQAEKGWVLFQEAAEALPGEFLPQSVQNQPGTAIRLPAKSGSHRLSRGQKNIAAGGQFRQCLAGLPPKECIQGTGPEGPVHRPAGQAAWKAELQNPEHHRRIRNRGTVRAAARKAFPEKRRRPQSGGSVPRSQPQGHAGLRPIRQPAEISFKKLPKLTLPDQCPGRIGFFQGDTAALHRTKEKEIGLPPTPQFFTDQPFQVGELRSVPGQDELTPE